MLALLALEMHHRGIARLAHNARAAAAAVGANDFVRAAGVVDRDRFLISAEYVSALRASNTLERTRSSCAREWPSTFRAEIRERCRGVTTCEAASTVPVLALIILQSSLDAPFGVVHFEPRFGGSVVGRNRTSRGMRARGHARRVAESVASLARLRNKVSPFLVCRRYAERGPAARDRPPDS